MYLCVHVTCSASLQSKTVDGMYKHFLRSDSFGVCNCVFAVHIHELIESTDFVLHDCEVLYSFAVSPYVPIVKHAKIKVL